MWAIKFLSGSLSGQTFSLNPGVNTLGRSKDCDIVVPTNQVSKEHAKIEVNGYIVRLIDNDSTNGTFVNGIKIRNKKVSTNDKLILNEIIFCLVHASDLTINNSAMPSVDGNLALQNNLHQDLSLQQSHDPDDISSSQPKMNFIARIDHFLESVVLPGIYALPKIMDMKWALALIFGLVSLAVCIFSYVPAINLMNEQVLAESAIKAKSVAQSVAEYNRKYFLRNSFNSITTGVAQGTGAYKIYILGENKSIIAPMQLSGQKPKEPFIYSRQDDPSKSFSSFFDGKVGAVVPISFRNNKTDGIITKGYSVAIFKTDTFSLFNPRILSRFVQSLFIIFFICGLGVFFIYKMIDLPIRNLNEEMDSAFREGIKQVRGNNFQFKSFSLLISNINSALNRTDEKDMSENLDLLEYDRSNEAINLSQMVGFPCLSINASDYLIIQCNHGFEEQTGLSSASLEHSLVGDISDQALKLSLENLIERAQSQPEEIHTNQLELSGVNSELAIQSIYGSKEVAYFVVVILPIEESYNE